MNGHDLVVRERSEPRTTLCSFPRCFSLCFSLCLWIAAERDLCEELACVSSCLRRCERLEVAELYPPFVAVGGAILDDPGSLQPTVGTVAESKAEAGRS